MRPDSTDSRILPRTAAARRTASFMRGVHSTPTVGCRRSSATLHWMLLRLCVLTVAIDPHIRAWAPHNMTLLRTITLIPRLRLLAYSSLIPPTYTITRMGSRLCTRRKISLPVCLRFHPLLQISTSRHQCVIPPFSRHPRASKAVIDPTAPSNNPPLSRRCSHPLPWAARTLRHSSGLSPWGNSRVRRHWAGTTRAGPMVSPRFLLPLQRGIQHLVPNARPAADRARRYRTSSSLVANGEYMPSIILPIQHRA